MRHIHTKTYIFTFIATIGVFLVASILSTNLTSRKTEELKEAEARIAINILSLETQYELLEESSCKTFTRGNLREELDALASKLGYMENQVGKDDPEVFRLKRYYTLLQIKDYLLAKKMSEQCGFGSILILYFYSDEKCSECQRQEYMLQAVRIEHPEIDIYVFDYNIDLSAVKTLISLHNIPPQPPVIDINGKVYSPFESLEQMKEALSESLPKATTTATSTIKKN